MKIPYLKDDESNPFIVGLNKEEADLTKVFRRKFCILI